MNTLSKLNNAGDDLAVSMISPLIERAPHIAEKVSKHRPFADSHALCDAILCELLKLNEEESLTLFRAHPELAPNKSLSMTSASQQEQGRFDLTSQHNEHRTHLVTLNAQYQEKFGFPFIVALARHTNMESVIKNFETRLAGNRASEMKNAIEQIHAVSAARIKIFLSIDDTTSPKNR
ncbi:hypothetical protein MUS1_12340 [Marinomonas ushuaiensis DSM 15871]|uniref:2-oxo-4-hydroxy-4-carboxy-5-ureidoimidazoline decarboxylase n=1 Tax=Marinomonas ushuaiensis DSM 15871 TaxID=1122207 RepID=X7E5E3_9GAMM|nr:2-oxo-4-hydroxy-4-carboxy-5-ureidoimidazoline decarboxylase [Marinomonas ushuaiensis]ETX11182.1 hypothetical protein MUS1_12340 [Marinomonas ushuaiensis DSM 15871]